MLSSGQEVEEQSLTAAKGCNNSCFASKLLMCLGSCRRHSRTNVAALSVSHVLPAQSVSRAAYKQCQCYTHTAHVVHAVDINSSVIHCNLEDCGVQRQALHFESTLCCDLAILATKWNKVSVSQQYSCTER